MTYKNIRPWGMGILDKDYSALLASKIQSSIEKARTSSWMSHILQHSFMVRQKKNWTEKELNDFKCTGKKQRACLR